MYLVNIVLFGLKDLQTSEMIVKLKSTSNLYVRPVNIFSYFWQRTKKKVWGEITNPFPNINSSTVDVYQQFHRWCLGMYN